MSSNVLAYTAAAIFEGMSQQEDAAPQMGHTVVLKLDVWSMLLPSGKEYCSYKESLKEER